MSDSYWATGQGEGHRRRARDRETLYSTVEQEPQRKRRRNSAAADGAFRQAVRADLVRSDLRGWPRAALALDFSFVTSRRQPAGIEAYPKHYQDLLEPRGRSDDEPPFLYRNDRQIKMLFVRCWHMHGRDAQPYIGLTCRPRRHAVSDLEAAWRLNVGGEDDDRFLAGVDDYDDALETAARAQELLEISSTHDRAFAEWNASYTAFDARRVGQETTLRANDRHLAHLLMSRASSILLNKPDPSWRALTRLGLPDDDPVLDLFGPSSGGRGLLDLLIQVPLPALPSEKGQSAAFRDGIAAACEQYVKANPIFDGMAVPLRLTLLVVPPAQGKDLDNIVLDVMKAVNAHFRPHQEPWLLSPSYPESDDRQEWRAEALKRLRQTVETGVASYQIIELARTEQDSEDGALTMILGHGDNMTSTWEEAGDYVDSQLSEGRL